MCDYTCLHEKPFVWALIDTIDCMVNKGASETGRDKAPVEKLCYAQQEKVQKVQNNILRLEMKRCTLNTPSPGGEGRFPPQGPSLDLPRLLST